MNTPLALIVTFSILALAFVLPARTTIRCARAIAGVALAVQVVAFFLGLIIIGTASSPEVTLWVAVAWLAFPISLNAFGLAMSLAPRPRVVPMWAASVVLVGMCLFLAWNVGLFIAPSAILMIVASTLALGSEFDERPASEATRG